MSKKILLIPFLAIYSYAAIEELDESNRVGSNMVVIHEYGSKKIFAKGELAYGVTSDIKNDRTNPDLGYRSHATTVTPTSGLFGNKAVKDIKFYETSPYQYSYFVPAKDTGASEFITTSFYFTGEGRISEGGIHSPIFKNKFNLNNFIAYCDRYKIEDCVNMLNGFDVKNVLYIGVKNGQSQTYGRDRGRFTQLQNKIKNAPLDEMTKSKALVKYDEMKNFLELAWEMPPSYYEEYLDQSITPYMFMTNNRYRHSPVGKFADNRNIPYGIRTALPYFTNSGNSGVVAPFISFDGDKKYYSFIRQKRDRFSFRRWYERHENVSYELTDPSKSVAYFGTTYASDLATPLAMYGVYSNGVKNGINGDIKAGSSVNRDGGDLARGNFLLASKSETNSIDKLGNYIDFRDRQNDKIAKLLSKNYLNSVRIYEINYGVSAKTVRSGKEFAAVSTFAKSSDQFAMENYFDPNANKLAFISKMNEYINLNYEQLNLNVKQYALHSEDSEGLYTEVDSTKKNSIDTLARINNIGKYSDKMGSRRYTTGIDFTIFANMNDFVLGHNAYNTAVERTEAYVRGQGGASDESITVDSTALNLLDIAELDDTDEDGRIISSSGSKGITGMDRWIGGGRYSSSMSCMLDNECFVTLIKSARIYNNLSGALDNQLFLNEDKYPAQVNIKRTLQTVYTPQENGIYQFFGPKYDAPIQYQGVYDDDNGQEITWCANIYKPITDKIGFKERTDSFLRYKQTPEDNWFYLLPDSEANGNNRTALELSNGTVKIGRAAEVIQAPTGVLAEKYEVGNSGSAYSYTQLVDIGGPMVSVGVGACPNHSAEQYLDNSLFVKLYPRPDYLHSQLSYRDAIEKYIDKYLSEDEHKVAICGGTESENNLDEIGMTCSQLLGSLKTYLLNNFTSEEYLKVYEGNYELKDKSQEVDPLNKFGLKYDMGDTFSVVQKKNLAAQENKIRDAARYVTEHISAIYFSPYNTSKAPSSSVRQILYDGVPANAIVGDFDSNKDSPMNKCAKANGFGVRVATGSDPLERSNCFDDLSGSVFGAIPPAPTPTPTPPASGSSSSTISCAGKQIHTYSEHMAHGTAVGPNEHAFSLPLSPNKTYHIISLEGECDSASGFYPIHVISSDWLNINGSRYTGGGDVANKTIRTGSSMNGYITVTAPTPCRGGGSSASVGGFVGVARYCEINP